MRREFIESGGVRYEARFADTLAELPEAGRIRLEVFVREQGFENEFDDIDGRAVHCVLYAGDGTPAAAGRLYGGDKGEAHIGRIAVVKSMRGRGLGSVMMGALEECARRKGYSSAVLSAQCRVKEFYRANGYTERGEEYLDEFCPHIEMYKALV